MSRSLLLLATAALFVTGCNRCYSDCCDAEDPVLIIQDMQAEIASVRNHAESSQTEIHLLEERVEEANLLSQTNLEVLHAQVTSLQRKIAELEGQQQAALTDIRELGSYAKESANALTEVQGHQDELKGAMESLATLQTESYKVVSGDTLEKIARKFDTTIGALKEENGLHNDRIYAGQTLHIP